MVDAPEPNEVEDLKTGHDWRHFKKGMGNIFSIPALILFSAFIGYGGITRDAGLSLGQAAFSVPAIWALPSNLIMVAGVASGATLVTILIAVALASLRMMPMTIALIPEIRGPGTKRWQLMLASCLVAVTAWVHTMQVARDLPPRGRLPYFLGFALTLVVGSTLMTALAHSAASQLPSAALAALYFLTPVYFAISIWKTSRVWAEHLSLILGICLCPVFMLFYPDAAILLAGFIGGLAAYLVRYGAKRFGVEQ